MKSITSVTSSTPLIPAIKVISCSKGNGPGRFGLGLHLTTNNIITKVDKAGEMYKHFNKVSTGMKVIKVNNVDIESSQLRLVDVLEVLNDGQGPWDIFIHTSFQM